MLLSFRRCIAVLLLIWLAQPAMGQGDFTVLDQAQDNAGSAAPASAGSAPDAPPPICGTQPLTIARMSWPSAALLAEIHARVLKANFACNTQIIPGDLAATGSSMGSSGEPAVAPELWVGRLADVWNAATKAQTVRPATTTYTSQVFEGWFMPDYLATGFVLLKTAAGLKDGLSAVAGGAKIRFISCPVDWACALINRNLIHALGLDDLLEVVEPANRFEMDTLIAAAISKQQPLLFYYWQPNAVLAQLKFVPIDLGAYDQAALQCLAKAVCDMPKPSSFAPETVLIGLAERVFTDSPMIAAYFGRASLPLEEMNTLLAQLSEPGASVESVADRFVAERGDVWKSWVGAGVP